MSPKIEKIKIFLKKVAYRIYHFVVNFVILNKKLLIIAGSIFSAVLIIFTILHFLFTKSFYYYYWGTQKIFTERRSVKVINQETSLQALVRLYLSGSLNYLGEIPFSDNAKIISISHDRKNTYLVINWNADLLKGFNDIHFNRHVNLLNCTVKKNYPSINTIYFLVEGKDVNLVK
ncbi:MAG: hypothetical protein ACRCTQ_02550 [Brevinemataceae bacterium]